MKTRVPDTQAPECPHCGAAVMTAVDVTKAITRYIMHTQDRTLLDDGDGAIVACVSCGRNVCARFVADWFWECSA